MAALRPPASTSWARRAILPAVAQSLGMPAPLASPSNNKRAGSDACSESTPRSTGSSSSCHGSRNMRRSATSVCSTSGLNAARISSSACCVGWQVTATQRTRPRAGCASRLAAGGASCRGESANTNPIASTCASRAADTASRVVIPQILIHMDAYLTVSAARYEAAPGTAAARTARPARSIAFASASGSPACISALPTSARS